MSDFLKHLMAQGQFEELKPMKVIDMTTKSSAKAYLANPPEETHTKEELAAVHRAIRFTQLFKQEESYNKMDEEEAIERSLPQLPTKLIT